jgi:hypothetical protein
MKKLLAALLVLLGVSHAQAQTDSFLALNGTFKNPFALTNTWSALQTFNASLTVKDTITINGATTGGGFLQADGSNSFLNVNFSNGVQFVGGFTPLSIAQAGGYNVISLNNANNGTSGLGIFGGANGDNLNVYYMAPAGGNHQWRVNGVTVANLNSGGGLTLGQPTSLNGVLGLSGSTSGQFLLSANNTATTINIGPLVAVATSGLISNNATQASSVGGLSILNTTTASHSTDTSDGAVSISGALTANSATNELVYRALALGGANNLTGGGHIQSMRIGDITAVTSASTTTDELDGFFFESSSSGTVTTGAAIRIVNWPGATKNTIWDTSGGNWVNNGQLTLGSVGGVNGTINFSGSTSGSGVISTGATGGHLSLSSSATPSLTAGCNGAGSSVSGSDISGTITGQTAAATTCTLTFGTAYGAAPNCVAMGISSPLTGAATPATGTLVVNFASTANYKFSYFCPGV